eukprot:7486752-Lingulodinium_polyedra.AAC.1
MRLPDKSVFAQVTHGAFGGNEAMTEAAAHLLAKLMKLGYGKADLEKVKLGALREVLAKA